MSCPGTISSMAQRKAGLRLWAVAFWLVKPLHYLAICLANPAAWFAADLLLIWVYFRELPGLLRQYPPDPETPLY